MADDTTTPTSAADDATVAPGELAPQQPTAQPEEPAQPAAPSFGLLFKAPEPVAAPPRANDRNDDGDDEDADDEQTDSADDRNDDGESSGRGRRRRRRGGRGRQRGSDDGGHSSGQNDSGKNDGGQDASSGKDSSNDKNDKGSKGEKSEKGDKGSGAKGDKSDKDAQNDKGDKKSGDQGDAQNDGEDGESGGSRRRRRRRRGSGGEDGSSRRRAKDEVTGVKGSTRLEAKRQRRREGREAGRRRTVITEAEFLARRESVEREMVVRQVDDRTQIGVLEDGVLVEHYISRSSTSTAVGNVYLGKVQNVLPSMEAAFVDIGRGRNAVLYAGEVNWDMAGLGGQPKRIENALKSGDPVLVQVTKDPIGHKGARLTSQVSLPGRYLVYVPGSSMTGISRKLPDTERSRLKKILKDVVPSDAGVIVRTAAEGASEAELRADVERLSAKWEKISKAAASGKGAPKVLHSEADMTVRVIRDVFNEDFTKLVVSGDTAWSQIKEYVDTVAPDLADRLERWTGQKDIFSQYRVDEAIAKAMDRKVWLPSGGSLVIDRTEAMTVVDVNTGKFVGKGGNLEETVTRNNIEAAEEIVRQLRLRDIGGIIVIDFIDMVLESNRDLVVRRLLECLGRDRTKHQVAEVTSLGLVQMTRKRVGAGLIEVFSTQCDHCNGRGIHVSAEPVEKSGGGGKRRGNGGQKDSGGNGKNNDNQSGNGQEQKKSNGPTAAQIAAAAHAAAERATSTTTTSEVDETQQAQGEASGQGQQDVKADQAEAAPSDKAGEKAKQPEATEPENTDAQGAQGTSEGSKDSAAAKAAAPDHKSDDAQPAPAAQPPVEEAKPRKRRRARAQSTVTSTAQADVMVAEAKAPELPLETGTVTSGTGTPTPAEGEEPEGGKRRRRRARVVAPAGPPSAGAGEGTAGEGSEA